MAHEIIGGNKVSIPIKLSGIIKCNINLESVPDRMAATAAGAFDRFQYIPKTNGTKQPAKMMSKASIKSVPGSGR